MHFGTTAQNVVLINNSYHLVKLTKGTEVVNQTLTTLDRLTSEVEE